MRLAGGTLMGESARRRLGVGVLGCGAVGSEVFRLLGDQDGDLAARVGAPLQVAGVAVRDPNGRARAAAVPPELVTTDAMGLVTRPDIDIVVEMIGGIEPARSLLLAAMERSEEHTSELQSHLNFLCPLPLDPKHQS